MRTTRRSWLPLLFAFALLSLFGCTSSTQPVTPTLTRDEVRAQLQQPDSVWVRALTPEFRQVLPKFANAPVFRQSLEYDPRRRKLSDTAEILFTNTTGHELPALYLRTLAKAWGEGKPNDFALTNVTVDGKPANFTLGQTLVTISLATPLKPGESVSLTYAATATVPKVSFARTADAYRYQDNTRDLSKNIGFYGVGPDVTALGGFPALLPNGDEGKEFDALPSNQAISDPQLFLGEVWLTLPNDWMVIAGGGVQEETPASGGKKRVHLVNVGTGSPLLVSNTVRKHSQQVGGLQVDAYVAPTFDYGYSDGVMKDAVDALQVFQAAYGPLPLTRVDLVAMPIGHGVGGVYQGGTLAINEPYLNDAQARRRLIAHELSHAWWGGVVIPDARKAPWIPEALANASALYLLDHADGTDAGNAFRSQWARAYQTMRGQGMPDAPLNWPIERYESVAYRDILQYYKGGIFFDRLRQLVGDDRFFAAMRGYLSSHRFELAAEPGPVADLMHDPGVAQLYQRWVLEAHGDEDLAPQLQQQ